MISSDETLVARAQKLKPKISGFFPLLPISLVNLFWHISQFYLVLSSGSSKTMSNKWAFISCSICPILDKPLSSLLHQTLKTQLFKGKFSQLNLTKQCHISCLPLAVISCYYFFIWTAKLYCIFTSHFKNKTFFRQIWSTVSN